MSEKEKDNTKEGRLEEGVKGVSGREEAKEHSKFESFVEHKTIEHKKSEEFKCEEFECSPQTNPKTI